MSANPADHPAAYASLSVGSITSLLMVELHNRFGIDVSVEEASFAVVALVAAFHFGAGWWGGRKKAA